MILAIGNVVVDIGYDVPAIPRTSETLVASGMVTDVRGKGFNQAVVCRRSGSNVHLIASIGNDAEGALIKSETSNLDFARSDLVLRDGISDRSIIFVADNGENCIVSTMEKALSLTIDDVEPFLEGPTSADTLLLQGNLTLEMTESALRRARSRGARTLANLAPITFDNQKLWRSLDVAVSKRPLCRQRIVPALAMSFAVSWLQRSIKAWRLSGLVDGPSLPPVFR